MSLFRRHPRLLTAALLVVSLAAAFLLTELGLRVAGYRFSPIVFVQAEGADDHRPFHMGAIDPRVSATDPLTVPDPELLWRPNPRVSAELTTEGLRGEPVSLPRPADQVLIVALGDSNTLGPLNTTDHWPGILQDLLRANRSAWTFQVVNAGAYGYTSFQGLRRFRQVLGLQPDLVYFSFGGNDAQPVRTTDELYAARVAAVRRWDGLRLAPPLFHLAWRAADGLGARPPTPRVPLADYRRNLQAFVDEARAAGVVPVLLTRPFVGTSDDPNSWLHLAPAYNEAVREAAAANGVPFLDAHALLAREPERFTDAMHNDRVGYRHLAEALLRQLRDYELLDTDDARDLASAVDLATADERRLELGPGFWLREARPAGPGGRWTDADARLTLERHHGERALLVDLTCRHPQGATRGRIEVNGVAAAPLPAANGRRRLWLDLGGASGPRVEVRFVVDSAYRPRDVEPGATDARRLGVFLHEVRLVDSPWPDALDLGVLEDGHPALGEGFWARETWPDGAGRWTKATAVFRMSAPPHTRTLWLDVRLQSPSGQARGTVSVNGHTLGRLDAPNGRRLLPFALPARTEGPLEVRLHVDSPFRPRDHDASSGDERTLGLVLHAAWLAGRPSASDGAAVYTPWLPLAETPDTAPGLWGSWPMDDRHRGRSPGEGAVLHVQRTASERWLEIEYTTAAQMTSGRFEVNGEMLRAFRRPPGSARDVIDVSRFASRVLAVKPVVDFPAASGQEAGLLLHEVLLKP
jgi:lysophospholipase L1-like esterase